MRLPALLAALAVAVSGGARARTDGPACVAVASPRAAGHWRDAAASAPGRNLYRQPPG